MRDLLDMRYLPSIFLISDRLKEIFLRERVSGWKPYPIRLFDVKGAEVFGYGGISITGRGGDYERLSDKNTWDGKYLISDAIYDTAQWDSSDIFLVRRSIFVTGRVAEILKREKIDAICLDPIEKVFKIVIWHD